jgi:hypothetical protein
MTFSYVWVTSLFVLLLEILAVILLVLVITTPIGSLFSLLTTRGLVRRIRRLAAATKSFADGD